MSEIEEYAKYNIELASDELLKGGEISNYAKCIIGSANYFKNNSDTLKELLRIKEEECNQLQQDKAELAEALSIATSTLSLFTDDSIDISSRVSQKSIEALCLIDDLLEKHKCD